MHSPETPGGFFAMQEVFSLFVAWVNSQEGRCIILINDVGSGHDITYKNVYIDFYPDT